MKKIIDQYLKESKVVPAVVKDNYLPSLDGLRAVSICIVLVAHINSHFGIAFLDKLTAAGIYGVYFFFVISGFLITTLLLKEKIKLGSISLKKFYTRRFLRIFPLAYLFIAVIAVLKLFFRLDVPNSDFYVAAFYLVNFFSFFQVSYYFNHYWSLSAEEQFYVFIPPLIKWNLSFYKILAPVLLVLSFGSHLFIKGHESVFAWKLVADFLRNIDGLLIGSILSLLVFAELIPFDFLRKNRMVINVGALVMVVLLKTEVDHSFLRLFFNHTVYALFIALFIINNLTPSDDLIFRFLNHKATRYVGILSYSIYIWQQIFTSSVMMKLFPFNLILIPLVAIVSYHYYEKFFLQLKRRFSIS